MIGAAVAVGVTQFVQYGNPNATGRKNTTRLPNGTGCAAKISRRFWLWLDSIASSIGRIENAASPPRTRLPRLSQLLHEYGSSARPIASGKYGLPSPCAANTCPSPWYGFQSGSVRLQKNSRRRARNGTITTDVPQVSAVIGSVGKRP